MQTILDRQMPVATRRRPFAWWLAGIFLLLVGGFVSWRQTRMAQPTWVNPPSNPVQAKSPTATAASVAIPEEEEDLTALAKTGGLLATSASPKRFNGTPIDMALDATVPAMEIPLVFLPPALANNSDIAGFDPFLINPREVGLSPRSTPLPSLVEMAVVAYVAKKQTKTWRFGVSTCISTERFIAVNGLNAGLSLDWQPLRKWGMRIGANYQTERPTVQSRPIANVSSKNYNAFLFNRMDVIGYGANNSYVDPQEEVLIPVHRLHYLELPALIFWQPWRPWRFYAGSTLGRTLYAKSEKYSYVSDKSPSPSSVLVESRSLNELATRQLSTWRIYGNTGLGFKPLSRFEIGFSGQFDFPGLRKNSDNAQYNASISDALNSKKSTPKPVYRRFQLSATLFF